MKQGAEDSVNESADAVDSTEAGPPESHRRPVEDDRRKPGKKGRRRSRTIATKRLSKDELALAEELSAVEVDRPAYRSQCANGVRPCPYVSCKHHLYLDVNERTGSIKLNFPDREVDELPATCALRVAQHGGRTLDAVAEVMALTRQRLSQLEDRILDKIRVTALDAAEDLDD